MAAETNDLRNKARGLKNLALTRAIDILENSSNYHKDIVNDTFLTTLKNAVPRTQEITGEEGESIKITFDKVFNESNAPSETTGDYPVQSSL